jgi:hypothetical protein
MRNLAIFVSLILTMSVGASARGDFWSPGAWNPLTKSKNSSVTVNNRANKKPSPTKAASKTLSQLTSAPGELISKTKQMLPTSKPAAKHSLHTRTIQRAKPKDEKPSFLKSMFVSEPPPPPRTVGEWMALKRIEP